MAVNESPVLQVEQAPAPGLMQYPAPYATVAAAQETGAVDLNSIINMVMPIMMLAMLFGMLTPMIKDFGK